MDEAARVEQAPRVVVAALHEAPLLVLHPPHMPRCDSTSPVLRPADGGAVVFVSHHKPIGHSYRREGRADLSGLGPAERVRILDDPDPLVGKWLEAVWPAPDGRLFGWYHAEEHAPSPRPLFIPHIGRVLSEDGGRSWRHLGVVLRAPAALADPAARNGFLAGGYGDFCVLPDQAGQWVYCALTSYVAAERLQGVALIRWPAAACDAPEAVLARLLECRESGAWRPLRPDEPPPPWLPVRRDWREADPDAFWGPAIHWNHSLGRYVMLLNRTRAGAPAFRQDGIFLCSGERLDRPEEWEAPRRLTHGGSWYPQVVGLGPRESDTLAGACARFFMAGRSAWRIHFHLAPADRPMPPAMRLSWEGGRVESGG